MERQKVIFWASRRAITDEDMEYQLTALTLQETSLKKELATYGEIARLSVLDDWEQAARGFFLDLHAGIESLGFLPESDQDADEIYQFKRGIIKALVNRVTIAERRELRVEIKMNILEMLEQAASLEFSEVQMVGTYTHIPPCRARRRRCAACG